MARIERFDLSNGSWQGTVSTSRSATEEEPVNATAAKEAIDLAHDWAETTRWSGIERDYTAEDVVRLRGSVRLEHTLARRGAERLWRLLHEEDYVPALGRSEERRVGK